MKNSAFRINFPFFLSVIALCFSTFFIPLNSQDFGRFKRGMNWQQINTPIVRVIFPKGLENQANRVANNINYLSLNNRTSIGPLSKKLNLILNNQGTISNGYVTLMPFRSEFYTTPMQDGFSLGTGQWLDLLSIHEYRHALQFTNMRQGYTKWISWLTGESGWGTLINITTPGWFFEGDAVATETALTKQGRGRMPSFLQQSKSILVNDKLYTYMKARNGSYQDIVPNEYELGYLLCSFGRDSFGNDLWPKVIRQTAWLKGIIYPFSNAVRANTKMGTRAFYKKALLNYKDAWLEESQGSEITKATRVTPASNTVTDYRFPVYLSNGDLLVYKESYKEIGAIYRITPEGKELKICTTGISLDPYFTANNNQVAWSEITWDKRYSAKDYSDIVIYQTDKSRKIYLTKKQRYFSPALSSDGKQIVAVEVDSLNNCRLKIISAENGTVMQTLPNPGNLFYTYPKWDSDGKSIISSVRTTDGNMVIIKQIIISGSISNLSGEYNQVIGEVLVTPESILFTAGFSGTNNIYSLARKDGKIIQLTGSRFGAYYPALSADKKRLAYSDFGIKGYGLVSVSMDSLMQKKIDPTRDNQMKNYEHDYFKAEGGNILDKIPDTVYPTSPYKLKHQLPKIHSWIVNPGFYSAGLTLISDDILSNLHVEVGADYYYNENAPGFNASVKYGGLFPILSAGVSRYYRHTDFLAGLSGDEMPHVLSMDDQLSLGIELPLNFTKGAFFRQLDINLGYNYNSVKNLQPDADPNLAITSLSSFSGSARFASIKKQAYQNITTPLGYSLELLGNQSVYLNEATLYQAIADFGIRGLAPNHNFVLSAGWKYEPYFSDYHFMDQFIYPRGFSIPQYDWMFTVQSTYHFTLLYPDLGFGGILYCSRVRGDIFADYGFASIPYELNNTSTGIFTSVGSELIFDLKWFNLVTIPMGVRFSLLLTPDFKEPVKKTAVEFVIPIIRL